MKQYRIREELRPSGRTMFWPEVKRWYGWVHVVNHTGGYTSGLSLEGAKEELREALGPKPESVKDRFHPYP